jgi:hypothetical protein
VYGFNFFVRAIKILQPATPKPQVVPKTAEAKPKAQEVQPTEPSLATVAFLDDRENVS